MACGRATVTAPDLDVDEPMEVRPLRVRVPVPPGTTTLVVEIDPDDVAKAVVKRLAKALPARLR